MAAKKPTAGKKLKEELLRLATELKTARYKEAREAIYSELIGIIHRL
jgi:hypothetical protein